MRINRFAVLVLAMLAFVLPVVAQGTTPLSSTPATVSTSFSGSVSESLTLSVNLTTAPLTYDGSSFQSSTSTPVVVSSSFNASSSTARVGVSIYSWVSSVSGGLTANQIQEQSYASGTGAQSFAGTYATCNNTPSTLTAPQDKGAPSNSSVTGIAGLTTLCSQNTITAGYTNSGAQNLVGIGSGTATYQYKAPFANAAAGNYGFGVTYLAVMF